MTSAGYEQIGLIIISISLIWNIYLVVSLTYKKRQLAQSKIENVSLIEDIQSKEHIDFVYIQEAMKFMDNIIDSKYNYYLYNVLMPIYLDKKIPEKKLVETTKEKIYVSVVGGLTPSVKKSILEFFTEKGIEIYIHERIIVLMNRTDFHSTSKNEAFKDLKVPGVDALIP